MIKLGPHTLSSDKSNPIGKKTQVNIIKKRTVGIFFLGRGIFSFKLLNQFLILHLVYKGGLKSSYDDVIISAVDDFLDQ